MQHTLFSSALICCTLLCCTNSSKGTPEDEHTVIKQPIDSIVIIKNKRQMEVYNHRQLVKVYHVCLGPNPIGPKHFRNDGKTPEGIYSINGKNPNSHYHKCLAVSYPNAEDVRYAQGAGKPSGGDIKIHGLPNGYGNMAKEYSSQDWTLGCIALTDNEIDELYAHVVVGTCVNILP